MNHCLSPAVRADVLARFADLLCIPPAGCTIQYGHAKDGRRYFRCLTPSGWDGNCGWTRLPAPSPSSSLDAWYA